MSASSSDRNTLINALGDELHAALLAGKPVAPLSNRGHELLIEDAYRIQQRMVAHRLNAGEKIVGKKVGATSVAVQNMLGVRQPDFGMLLSGMIFNEGDVIPFDSLIQPKAEGEIAFILKRDITGPGVTIAEVIAATECVMPCFEIVDSRIENWKLKIQDTVADNASCGVFALGGSACNPRKIDLDLCGMALERNGDIFATGSGAAALGHPANAVAWLANTLGPLGMSLKAGEVVLSGSLTAMAPIARGDHLRVELGGIGECSVRFA